jgi:hypothetical protein
MENIYWIFLLKESVKVDFFYYLIHPKVSAMGTKSPEVFATYLNMIWGNLLKSCTSVYTSSNSLYFHFF